MNSKKVIALLLSLVSLFTMVCCTAVTTLAAKKDNKKKIVSQLKKEDFNFVDANGNVAEYEGGTNYIDWYAKGGSNSVFLYGFSACPNPIDNNGNPYSMGVPGGYETDVYMSWRPGIHWGSTEAEVQAVYGKAQFRKYNSENGLKLDTSRYNHTIDHTNVPSECCVYAYYKTGRVYLQIFDFNDEKQLCRIQWDSHASDGYTYTADGLFAYLL